MAIKQTLSLVFGILSVALALWFMLMLLGLLPIPEGWDSFSRTGMPFNMDGRRRSARTIGPYGFPIGLTALGLWLIMKGFLRRKL
jgi:hypothetical protein